MLFVLFCVLAPLAGGLVLLLLPEKAKGPGALMVTCLSSALCLYLAFAGNTQPLQRFSVPFLGNCFLCWEIDGAGRVYLGVAALLWPLSVLYALDYMKHEERQGQFFAWYTLTYAAAVLLACSGNLFTLYINYEFLTLLTLPLVFHKQDRESLHAVKIYMLYLFGGAALGFVSMMGFTFLGADGFVLGGIAGETRFIWIAVLTLLGFFGFGVKAAVLPLCRWLPAASVAPTPVTALLHAVAVVNAGVYAVMRLLYYAAPMDRLQGTWVQTVLLMASAATVVYASALAVREQHVKRRLAFSTVSNLSYMLLGLSLLTLEGFAAGMAHMVFHSLTKIILFFCAGSVLTQTGRTQVRQMHGLGRYLPLTFGAFALAGISLVGVPPLPGFVSKYALVTAAFSQGGVWPYIGACALIVSAILTAVYIFTVVFPSFFMKPVLQPGESIREGGARMRLSLVLLCLLLILSSVFAGRIMDFIASIAGGGW